MGSFVLSNENSKNLVMISTPKVLDRDSVLYKYAYERIMTKVDCPYKNKILFSKEFGNLRSWWRVLIIWSKMLKQSDRIQLFWRFFLCIQNNWIVRLYSTTPCTRVHLMMPLYNETCHVFQTNSVNPQPVEFNLIT